MEPQRKKPRAKAAGYPDGQSVTGKTLDRVSSDLLRKLPPQNLDAEKAVLGGVLLKNTVLFSLIDLVGEDDFYSPVHKTIYRAFLDLSRKNAAIDMVTLADELSKAGRLEEVGGPLYLAELAQSTVGAANALHHARIVREKSVQRRLIGAATDIITRCFEATQDINQLLDESEQAIFAIADAKTVQGVKSSKELVAAVFEQIEKRMESKELVTGVPTGYYQFDEYTAGLQPSDLIIIAGRPSMGKTAFALNVAMRSAAMHGVPTAIFSLEMSMEQLMQRMLCSWAKVDLSRLRRGRLDDDDWARLYEAANNLSPAPIFIDDTAALTTMEMRARCRRLKAEHGLGLVVVDYLQLMRASRHIDSREQEISDISRNLKALAKELHLPVVALSQLNRKVEERGDKRPMMSDLRESGAIEQDADVIIFLYRAAAYKRKEELTPEDNVAEIIIGKQRNGPTGMVKLTFFKEYTAFENLSDIPPPSEYGA
ncbi:replicative DNA helicase [Desulfolutivibrio sulfoxidireducens]|uniref:replicative DNA helicase n=1 Tax=Desulfolutivibrio sulfoxidireducens TaxID=2773299 RepID=UPI00159EB3E7|nr:replicative DNA helicase [Desulfolutivibrio sulfoxidireducens]QLA16349.1 replicative DNA helicase [Desulfolutivibrio sulfoxidireducens]QLA19759.1 replicative DNA helicase [Desulfolutivibrio sulfoxidireducens]